MPTCHNEPQYSRGMVMFQSRNRVSFDLCWILWIDADEELVSPGFNLVIEYLLIYALAIDP